MCSSRGSPSSGFPRSSSRRPGSGTSFSTAGSARSLSKRAPKTEAATSRPNEPLDKIRRARAPRDLLDCYRRGRNADFGPYSLRSTLMDFLTHTQIQTLRREYGTPVYVYDQALLERAAREVLAFPNVYGLTARYAMKALPTAAIVRILTGTGLHIDASSGFEAERALLAGVAPEKIQLSAQELPQDLKGLVERGVLFNACSLEQLEAYGRLFPGREVSVR
ncbi:MAG TPA: hypothetical protein EYQ66_06990, partial [Myxococcales bacterium]|nr:hypothetical protein [Myxococcales bacterium]